MKFVFECITFSAVGLLALRKSTCIFYRNSVSELLNQKEVSNPFVECTEQREVAQIDSVSFLCELFPFSTIVLLAP